MEAFLIMLVNLKFLPIRMVSFSAGSVTHLY